MRFLHVQCHAFLEHSYSTRLRTFVQRDWWQMRSVLTATMAQCCRCVDGRQPTFDVINTSVDVLRTDSVLLQLAGSTTLDRDQQHLLVGDKLFFDLVITASQRKRDQTAAFDYELKV